MVRNTRHDDVGHYLKTVQFQQIDRNQRLLRTLYLDIEGIEPRSKKAMRDTERLKFQTAVLCHLKDRRRRAFQSQLAAEIRLETTIRNPAHPHTIVKNLLDLLARPLRGLQTRRRALAYQDDAQIDVLSVVCHHGRSAPRIRIKLRPLRDLLVPLGLAFDAGIIREEDSCWDENDDLLFAGERLSEIRADEIWWRSKFGDAKYENLEQFALQSFQGAFLGQGGLTVSDIAAMFDLGGRGLEANWSQLWQETYDASLLRIRLTELPQREGQSANWKTEIDAKLAEFRSKWAHILDPLLVPVALEVVVKPPPPSRKSNVHDLDNVLRSYLLPSVVTALRPPSHFAFTLGGDAEALPPRSTQIGVSRYEAWRLPPAAEGADAFVSLSIVADLTGHGSVLGRMDRAIDKWVDQLD
jgi:Holliday junction resolvase RusA-like endonuclease